MANVKITALTAITPAAADVLPVVDTSENVTRKTTVANIPRNATNGTAAAPAHSFASDPGLGIYRAGANRLAFTTGGTQKIELASGGNVLIGGTLPSAPAISLNNNGSANFSSPVTINGAAAYYSSAITTKGYISIESSGAGTDSKIFFISTTGHAVASLNADGDNTTGYLDFYTRKTGSNYKRARIDDSGDFLLGGTLPSAPAISLNNDGSSTFQGELTVNRPTGSPSALVIRENNVEKIKLKPTGQAFFSGPVSIGGTADINTIDLYEEGSYTPFLTSGTGAAADPTQSYASQSASYVRIGKLCSVKVLIKFASSGVSAGTGNMRVNLPFIVSGFPAGTIGISKSFTANLPVAIQGSSGNSFVVLKSNFSNDNCNCSTVQNNSQISFSLVYEVN